MAGRRSSHGKLLNIKLDSPPNYIYTNGEAISGRVTLRSSSDEDVYSIVILLTGIGKSYVGIAGRNTQTVGLPDQLRFPDSTVLIPSGSHGKHQMMSNGDTGVKYELTVSRASSENQARALLDKAANGQEADIVSKLRGLIASTTSIDLAFLPSRPSYIPSQLTPTREVWTLPVHAMHGSHQPDDQSKNFSLKSIFRAPLTLAFTVRVDLPKSFVQHEHIPAYIRIIPKYKEGELPVDPGPITVEKVEFIVSMRVRHKASGFVGENLEKFTILKLDHPGIVIRDSMRYDIGGKYNATKAMWPTFNSTIVETRHILRAHMRLKASGKKFEDIFPLADCKIYANRVTPSPLNKGYICSFFPLSSGAEGKADSGSIPHKDTLGAFFVVSRLFTSQKIIPKVISPHDPSAILALYLPGQMSSQARPHALASETRTLPGSLPLPDPLAEDQRWLSTVLANEAGIQSATGCVSDHASFAYRYGGAKSASQVRLEFSDPAIAASSIPPPSYSDPPQSSESPPSTPSSLTIPQILSILLHSLATSSPSQADQVETNVFTVSNIVHLCEAYSTQIRPECATVDSAAAAQTVGKYPELRKPLVDLAGVDASKFPEEEDDEPKPKVLTKEEAKFERQKELANKVGYWSPKAQKRDQIFASN